MRGDMRTIEVRFCWVAIVSAILLSTGCGGTEEALRGDMAGLQARIAELERNSGRYQVQLNDLDEEVLLLSDRVEAHRISLERREMIPQRGNDALPVYEPPAPEPDYSYLAELPVQRLEPAMEQGAEPMEQGVDPMVINNDTLRDFVDVHGGEEHYDWPSPSETVQRYDTVSTAVLDDPPDNTIDPLSLYQLSLRQFNEGSYEEALEGFQFFMDSGPSADLADNAVYWIGECHYARGHYDLALATFQQVVTEYPDGNKIPDSLLKIGLTYERLNDLNQATEVLSSLIETYPLTDAARRASQRLTDNQ